MILDKWLGHSQSTVDLIALINESCSSEYLRLFILLSGIPLLKPMASLNALTTSYSEHGR